MMGGVCLSVRLSLCLDLTQERKEAKNWQDGTHETYSEVKRSKSPGRLMLS